MPELIPLGPLHLQTRLLVLLLAAAAGYAYMRRQAREASETERTIIDITVTSAVIVLLFWKLGPLLASPDLLWTPLKALMVTGTVREVVIGLFAASLYAIHQSKKRQLSITLLLDYTAYALTAGTIVYFALTVDYGKMTELPWAIGYKGTISRFHPVNAYFAFLLAPLFIMQLVKPYRPGDGRLIGHFLTGCGLAGLAVSLCQTPDPTPLYVSWAQIVYISFVLFGMRFSNATHNTSRKEMIEMANNDSKMQTQQEQENQKARQDQSSTAKQEGFVDKKLDGPNRPAE